MKKAKKEKRRITAGGVVARILIFAGLALMLTAGGYEAANYPWRILCMSQEDLNNNDLPDPVLPQWDDDAVTQEPTEDDSIADESLFDIFAAPDLSVIQIHLGYLKIPKLDLAVNIFEGSAQEQLILGAGHVRGTPMPKEPGNVCIAGHRVTARMHPLRHMDKMQSGDFVFVISEGHVFKYETLEVFAVANTETWVMQPVEGEDHLLTLISCHPPGSARQRLILRGRLLEVDGAPVEEFFGEDPLRFP